jgi:hypothetical protein
MRTLILAALLAAGPALAGDHLVARQGADVARLTQQPCPAAVLEQIPQHVREQFRLALMTVDGRSYDACWALRVDRIVQVVYHDGEGGLIPMDHFKREPGV